MVPDYGSTAVTGPDQILKELKAEADVGFMPSQQYQAASHSVMEIFRPDWKDIDVFIVKEKKSE